MLLRLIYAKLTLIRVLGNVYTNFDFSTFFFYFRVTSTYGTYIQMDGQTDEWQAPQHHL